MTIRFRSRDAKLTGAWLCSLALLAASAATCWGRPVVSTTHLTEANTLLGSLSLNNTYDDDGISNSSITWDGSAAYTNCSTFITLLLKHSYNWADGYFTTWLQTTSPNAARYHDAIEQADGFTQVFYQNQIQPGDLIAIEYPVIPGGASGHAMLVAEAPTLQYPNPTQAQLDSFATIGTPYKVTVIDSSSSFHGPTDTRRPVNGGSGEGIGKGVVVIHFDASGLVKGYRWSTYSSSEYFSQAQKHLVIGRLL